MMFRPKTIITIFSFCVLVGVLLVFLYSLTDPDTRFRHKRTELYNKKYEATLDSCKKWGGTFSGNVDVERIANTDSNFTYLAILEDRYKALDEYYLRPFLFCDICGDSIWTLVDAEDDAKLDYLKSRYGKRIRTYVRMQSRELNEKYRIVYYDSILSRLTKNAFKRRMIHNSIEVGEFDKTFLKSLPFRVKIDTSNKGWFSFTETKSKIMFKATQESYYNPKKFMLPSISFCYYFDSEKTNFPYSKYLFKKIIL